MRGDSGALRLPARFDGQLLWMEWCRGLLVATPIRPDGKLDNRPEQVKIVFGGGASSPVPSTAANPQLRSPIDAAVGPDGAVYVAEYASRNYNSSSSRISRIKCTGCRPSSADYGGALVVDSASDARQAAVIPVSDAAGGGAPVVLALMGMTALVYGIRRSRGLV
jgi:hypothetical protein